MVSLDLPRLHLCACYSLVHKVTAGPMTMMMMRAFLLILCWPFAHAKYCSLRFSHRFLQKLHYEETGEQPLQIPVQGANRCINSHPVLLRNRKRGIIGADLLKISSSKGDQWQGSSALKVADLLRGGGSGGVATDILASRVTCVLAVIASVGLRMLEYSGDSTSNHPILVTALQRFVNYYLIGYFFFALVQWQKRVQEQNSKRR